MLSLTAATSKIGHRNIGPLNVSGPGIKHASHGCQWTQGCVKETPIVLLSGRFKQWREKLTN
jgi:hypothetical protein